MWGVDAISVTNSATDVVVELPTMLKVSYITIWRLRRLLTGRYYLVLQVLNGLEGSLEEVVILKLYRKNCIQSIQCCISRRSKTAKIKCYKL